MNNDKGEMTQNEERPLSNKETREVLRLMHCLGIRKDYHNGPIEEGDHAEIAKRRRRVRGVPNQMKHHFKGYTADALRAKESLVNRFAVLLDDENWLTTARNGMGVYHTITHGVADQWHLEEMDKTCDTVPEGEEGEWALWETSANDVNNTIRLVQQPSFAAKLWGAEETEEVAA